MAPIATPDFEDRQDGLIGTLVSKLGVTKISPEEPIVSTADILSSLSLPEKVFLLSGTSFVRTGGIAKHNLHPIKTSDGPTDIRGDTVFNGSKSIVIPNATSLASTWDLEAIEGIGKALAAEAKLKTVDILLAPTLNLHRDSRGGRNQESYGEDGFLAGKCGAAFVRGVQSQGVPCCIKHLVCNDSETERRFYDVEVDEQVLREIYMRPFEIAVKESDPRSIMTSYNKINGKSAAQNAHTMGIVRNEWDWKGLFISDWFGTYDGVESVKAGLDLEMPFPAARGPNLLKAVAQGELSEADLDPLVTRMINFLKDCKAPLESSRGKDRDSDRDPQRTKLNRQIAAEGIILLQNDGVLPLRADSTQTIGVIGSLATDRVLTPLICPSYLVTPLTAIKEALSNRPQGIRHAHGVQTHKVVPKLDGRFSKDIRFNYWNIENHGEGSRPVAVHPREEALEAMLMDKVDGLESSFEIEMAATVKVPSTGPYHLGVIAASTADVFVDEVSVFKYDPGTVVDIQKFLFHGHQIAQDFLHDFEAGRDYTVRVVAKSQVQSGREPVAQGLIVGMVESITRERSLAEAVKVATGSDVTVVFVGTTAEWEMEGVDRQDITLPCGQDEMLRAVIQANPRTIVVNQSGAAVDLGAASGAAAIIHAHFCGQEAGNAIADVLFGKINPSAKTTYTWPRKLSDMASFANFPCSEDLSLRYAEGLRMGWRGLLANGTAPAYPFGFGLSYTTFGFDDLQVAGKPDETEDAVVQVKVTNTGSVSGREVVQVYVESERKTLSLESFAKTTHLAPGRSQTLQIPLSRRAFASWSTASDAWEVVAGTYRIYVARSVVDRDLAGEILVRSAMQWTGL